MPVETLTKDATRVPVRVRPVGESAREKRLKGLALEQIYRLRRLKLHAAVFALGAPALGVLWVLTEYYEEHTWPDRFASAPDVAGTWDPWFFWVAGIWAIVLAVHALKTYLGPPVGPLGRYIRRSVSADELAREVERQRASWWNAR